MTYMGRTVPRYIKKSQARVAETRKTSYNYIITTNNNNIMDNTKNYYLIELTGEGCWSLCYDDETGNRIVVDRDIEIRDED